MSRVRVDAAATACAPRVLDLEGADGAGIVPAWRALASEVEDSSYFQTPDWVLAWWATVARRPRTRLALWCEADGRLSAVAAVSDVRRRPDRRIPLSVPVLANAGSGPGDADHCGPLVAPGRELDVASWLTNIARTRALVLQNIASPRGAFVPRAARPTSVTTCPRLRIEDLDPRFIPSAGFRRQLRRYECALADAGVTFEWVEPGRVGAEHVDALIRLHFGRRSAAGGRSSLDERHRALLHRLTASAEPGRGPAAVVARAGERIVAELVGFRWKDSFAAYQSGWHSDYAAHSLGSVLVHQSIRLAAAHGVGVFDFLRGAETYKYRFGAIDRYDESFLVPTGASGLALQLGHAVRTRVRRLNAPARIRTGRRPASTV